MPSKETFINVRSVIKDSLATVIRDPQIIAYPILAFVFISITFPLLSSSIFHGWYDRIFSLPGDVVPNKAGVVLGFVSFSAFYTAFVTSFFTCATAAAVLAKLEGKDTPPLYGLLRVVRHWFRVARFAILSVFLFPVGIYAQRRKLPRGVVGVLGSSLTLHMPSLAPAILTTHKSYGETVRDAINTLGRLWREGLILKIGMYLSIFVIIILPKLIQHGFFSGHAASNVGWLVSLELAASSYTVFKVINAIFTSVLYHKAKSLSSN